MRNKELLHHLKHLHDLIGLLGSDNLIVSLESNLKSKDVSTLLSKASHIIELLIFDVTKNFNNEDSVVRILNLTKLLSKVVLILDRLREFLICQQRFFKNGNYFKNWRAA